MKRFLIVILFFSQYLALAQSTNILNLFQSSFKKAEELYSHLAYRNALELYLVAAEKDPSNYVARQRIADCNFRLGNIDEAENWYASLAATPNISPKYIYQYAQVLSIQGKYADAQKWFSEYQKLTPDARGRSKIDFIYYLSYYFRDSVLYEVKNEPFNSDQSDFAPQYHSDGVVFVSARDRDLFVKKQSTSALNDKEAMLNIFFAPKESSDEKDATFFYHQDLNSPYHDGPIAFYGGGRRVVFSRNNLAAGKPVHNLGKVHLKLYFAELDKDNSMKRIEPFQYNDDSYSIGHPWMSEDGNMLYFASDRPGGEGGVDIYTSERKDGKWAAPKNLGPNVNTMGDEFYPFMSNDTTLYFSSTGHGGLGGLDIYVSHRRDATFTLPENLGFPLNTSSDDFSMVMDASGRKGLFSSNREGGVGYDDIYSFNVKSFFVVGKVIERDDSTKAVPAARVLVLDEKYQAIDSATSDENGNFYFGLAFDRGYNFKATKEGFTWIDSLEFSTNTRTLGRDSILIPLWKNALFAKGTVYSNEAQHELQDVTITLENLIDGKIDSVITNSTGAYNFLVTPNKKYRITAKKEGFIPLDLALNTTGIKNGDLLNDFVLEEVFMEKVLIQFEFDKWEIKSENNSALENLAKIVRRNPKSHIHIGAYADARGTHEYNQALSDKRANRIVKFFETQGIEVKRMTAIGFGEELHLNHCSNGVECSKEEHAKNRRAELKVQLWKD
ncbi:MAG: OmpA family protein [Bacteroidia bacterium]|nr:OmpA family protein [Bacteroidia bacterium]